MALEDTEGITNMNLVKSQDYFNPLDVTKRCHIIGCGSVGSTVAKVKTKEKTPEPKRGSAAASTNQERMSEGQKKLMNTMSDLFPNIFKSNKDN